jgi:hypothetical protein
LVDDKLRKKYGFTDDQVLILARSAQELFKSFIPRRGRETAVPYPLSCSTDPWTGEDLASTAAPGMDGGPVCDCSSYYMEDEDKLGELIALWKLKDTSYLTALEFSDRKKAVQLMCSRMAFDGEMASSGAAMDPLFWVAHGAIERLFQRVTFDGTLADRTYATPMRNAGCSGHTADGTKEWLRGLYFQDTTVNAHELTNAQLAAILDPTSDSYRDMIDFVYEDSTWSWCSGSENWFPYKAAAATSSVKGGMKATAGAATAKTTTSTATTTATTAATTTMAATTATTTTTTSTTTAAATTTATATEGRRVAGGRPAAAAAGRRGVMSSPME